MIRLQHRLFPVMATCVLAFTTGCPTQTDDDDDTTSSGGATSYFVASSTSNSLASSVTNTSTATSATLSSSTAVVSSSGTATSNPSTSASGVDSSSAPVSGTTSGVLPSSSGSPASSAAVSSSTSQPSSGASSGGGSSSSAAPDMTITEFIQGWQKAVCNYEAGCATERGWYYADSAACTGYQDFMDRMYRWVWNLGYWDFLNANYTVGNQQAARTCIDSYATAACDIHYPDDPACREVGAPVRPSATGEQCNLIPVQSANLCDDATAVCLRKPSTSECYLCTARGDNGAECGTDAECLSGFCSTPGYICKARMSASELKRLGEACAETDECMGNTECMIDTAGDLTRKCLARGDVDATCDSPAASTRAYPLCREGLDCVVSASNPMAASGTCKARLDDGATCTRNNVVTIADGDAVLTAPTCKHLCVFANKSSTNGTCQDLQALPGAGSPCAQIPSSLAMACLQDGATYPKITLVPNSFINPTHVKATDCDCLAMTGEGQNCYMNQQCRADLRCNASPSNPLGGNCVTKLDDGQSCNVHTDCASGYCDGVTDDCTATPACP